MSCETITRWLKDEKIKSYQIWETLPLTFEEYGKVLDPNEHHSLVHIDDRYGVGKNKVCDKCITKEELFDNSQKKTATNKKSNYQRKLSHCCKSPNVR